ncbi:hypothetical protein ACLOJK_008617 [Asimina triloba]
MSAEILRNNGENRVGCRNLEISGPDLFAEIPRRNWRGEKRREIAMRRETEYTIRREIERSGITSLRPRFGGKGARKTILRRKRRRTSHGAKRRRSARIYMRTEEVFVTSVGVWKSRFSKIVLAADVGGERLILSVAV